MSEVLRFPESLPRGAHPPKAMPSDTVRPTRAEIDLSCIRFNLRSLRQRTSAQIWAVLKADGYGHGAKTIGRTLERAGVDGLCVALVEEGIELRTAGIDVPILVMSNWYGGAYSELLEHQLTPVIYEPKQLKAFAREAERHNRTAVPIHIKVDTGMSRLGTMPSELGELLGHLKAACRVGALDHCAA